MADSTASKPPNPVVFFDVALGGKSYLHILWTAPEQRSYHGNSKVQYSAKNWHYKSDNTDQEHPFH